VFNQSINYFTLSIGALFNQPMISELCLINQSIYSGGDIGAVLNRLIYSGEIRAAFNQSEFRCHLNYVKDL